VQLCMLFMLHSSLQKNWVKPFVITIFAVPKELCFAKQKIYLEPLLTIGTKCLVSRIHY